MKVGDVILEILMRIKSSICWWVEGGILCRMEEKIGLTRYCEGKESGSRGVGYCKGWRR